MSKAQNKTRKKQPNLKLIKNNQNDTDEDSQYDPLILTPHMRIYEAKRILSGDQLPSKFKFRAEEINKIETAIRTLTTEKKEQKYRILMLTGSPGAGKTLCANNVLHKLEKENFKVIYFNANSIKKKSEVQSLLASELLGIKNSESESLNTFQLVSMLEKSKMPKTILYIEEIELFFESRDDEQSEDFFDLFLGTKNLKIVLLGISNKVDSLFNKKNKLKFDADSIQNIVFNTYKIEQMKELISDKIKQVKASAGIELVFDEGLIRFTSNKLDALKKGDMRIVFIFLKNLGNLLFSEDQKEIPPVTEITIELIKKAFCLITNEKHKVISNLPFNQQMILIAIYQYCKETDELAITEEKLKMKMKQIHEFLGLEGKKEIKKEEIEGLCDYAMIALKPIGKKSSINRYILKIPFEDVEHAFYEHPTLSKLMKNNEKL